MYQIQYRQEENACVIAMMGHIDSTNASKAEQEMLDIRNRHPQGQLILDGEKLDYISSAGLRIILRLRKNEKDMKIAQVQSSVYEILEMTGFTEMIPVEKAYRRLSIEGCEVIGQGANGKVYRLDPDTIIKVYFNPDALPDIQRERDLARKAFVLGIPTAIPYDVVKVGEGYGSVFELLNAQSFSKLIAKSPEKLDEYVGLYVDLLKKIHLTHVKPGDMPSMKAVALGWAKDMRPYLAEGLGDKLCSLVEAVPDQDTMMHGDYHTKNIMMQNGETLLIDMDTLCCGHPVFELASMFLAYQGFAELDHSITQSFLGLSFETTTDIWEKSLALYLDGRDEAAIRQVANQAKIIGYTRLMRRTIRRQGFDTEEGRRIIKNAKEKLEELLQKADTLVF